MGDGKTQAEKPHIRRPPAPTIAPIASSDRTDVNGIADRPEAGADILRTNVRRSDRAKAKIQATRLHDQHMQPCGAGAYKAPSGINS